MEAEGSKFHRAANRVTDYDADRLRETTKLDKLQERNLLRRLWAPLNSRRSKPNIFTFDFYSHILKQYLPSKTNIYLCIKRFKVPE